MSQRKLIAIAAIVLVLFGSMPSLLVQQTSDPTLSVYQQPKEGDDEQARDQWLELIHKAAPGTNWRTIENENRKRTIAQRDAYLSSAGRTMGESFGNGALQGEWEEKGSDNQAGRVGAVDYFTETDELYLISHGFALWKKNLSATGNPWVPLNKDIRCHLEILKVVRRANGQSRILIGSNNTIQFSDDEGKTFTPSSGITFPVVWGDNLKNLVVLNDAAQTIYCLALCWDPTPWAPRYWLFKSTDLGQTFTKIHTFPVDEDGKLSLTVPQNATEAYALDTKSQSGLAALYRINGSTVTLLNKTTGPESNKRCLLKGSKVNNTTVLYALSDNKKLFVSSDFGASWTLQSTLPFDAWDCLEVAKDDPGIVFFGAVEAFRSTNSGSSWTMANGWGEYYSYPVSKLHADIMEIAGFKKKDGSNFLVINTDGGSYLSYDNLVTCTNISLSTLRTSEYYDVLTDQDNPNYLFAASQDQGLQLSNNATLPGARNFYQIQVGDFTQLTLSGTEPHLWTQYPGANVYYFHNAKGNLTGTWRMPGARLSNYGWVTPMTNTINEYANEVLIGGGDLSGGNGSYLIKLKPSASPFNIIPSQYNYNFRANSKNGQAGVTVIETDKKDSLRMYVATEDGTFFYTTDGGSTWNKTSSFTGPTPGFLYGTSIYASRLTPNLLWYGGTGYSNPPVYRSADGGKTFEAIRSGLPSTVIYKLVANPSETLLFAATEAGPYVYVVAENKWYSMMGANNPAQTYTSVQYVRELNVVRFGTYGRGIWDFKISNAPPPAPKITIDGATSFCTGSSITLTSSGDNGNQWYKDGVLLAGATDKTYQVSQSGTFSVKRTVNGLTSLASNAVAIQEKPLPAKPTIAVSGNSLTSSAPSGNQWYLNNAVIPGATGQTIIAQASGQYTVAVIQDGCKSISDALSFVVTSIVNPNAWNGAVLIYPNPLQDQLYIKNSASRKLKVQVLDLAGRVIMLESFSQNLKQITTSTWLPGNYLLMITDLKKDETIVKKLVKH